MFWSNLTLCLPDWHSPKNYIQTHNYKASLSRVLLASRRKHHLTCCSRAAMMLVNKLKRSRWKIYKPRDTKPGELTWWRFLAMGSSGGENGRSRACYATLRERFRGQTRPRRSNGRRHFLVGPLCAIIWVQEPIRATKSRAVASRIVWTVLLISLEPNHAT